MGSQQEHETGEEREATTPSETTTEAERASDASEEDVEAFIATTPTTT